MTRQRNDSHSTEFGIWVRNQSEIDSKLGYVASNIDFMWMNYNEKLWMLIEEKRHGARLTFSQSQMYQVLDKACRSDPNYQGLHLLVFEKTNPLDSDWIRWDDTIITTSDLISILQFQPLILSFH